MRLSRRRVIAAVAAATTAGVAGLTARAASARYYDGPVSDHFDGTRFFDVHGAQPRSFTDLLRWRMSREANKWPDWSPSPYADRPPFHVEGSSWRISFVGHASLLLQTAG